MRENKTPHQLPFIISITSIIMSMPNAYRPRNFNRLEFITWNEEDGEVKNDTDDNASIENAVLHQHQRLEPKAWEAAASDFDNQISFIDATPLDLDDISEDASMRLNDQIFGTSLLSAEEGMKTNIQSVEGLAEASSRQDTESETDGDNQFVVFIPIISAFS